MKLITHPTSLLAALVAAMLATGVATAAASDGSAGVRPVGHTVKSIDVRGSAQGEHRKVDVHLGTPLVAAMPPLRPGPSTDLHCMALT